MMLVLLWIVIKWRNITTKKQAIFFTILSMNKCKMGLSWETEISNHWRFFWCKMNFYMTSLFIFKRNHNIVWPTQHLNITSSFPSYTDRVIQTYVHVCVCMVQSLEKHLYTSQIRAFLCLLNNFNIFIHIQQSCK